MGGMAIVTLPGRLSLNPEQRRNLFSAVGKVRKILSNRQCRDLRIDIIISILSDALKEPEVIQITIFLLVAAWTH